MAGNSEEAWSEALIFLTAFVLVNAVIMLVFWFSYAITSSNRMSSIDFSDFGTGGRRNIGDQPDQQSKLLMQDDQDFDAIIARASGLFSNPRQSSGSSDRSSLSDLGFNSSSDEDFIASMSGQALSSTTDTRFCHRTVSLQKQRPAQQKIKPESVGKLQHYEEEDTEDFNKLLTSLAGRKDKKSKDPRNDETPNDKALTPRELKEFLRYHTLVPIRRFDPSFLWKTETLTPVTPSGPTSQRRADSKAFQNRFE